MPYYGQGDYYAAGDPGLFSAIGGALKRVGGAAVGFVTGGAAGAVRGAINPGSIFGGAPAPPGSQLPTLPPIPTISQVGTTAIGHVMSGSVSAAPGGMAPRGYHLNRSGYFLKSGQYVAPGTRWVRNRSRNPLNPRALRRSISRVDQFVGRVKSSRKALKKIGSL